MDVLLVNPRFYGKSEIPPLGLECLAAVLLENRFSVSILDLDVGSADEAAASLAAPLETGRPKIVGVTSLSDTFSSAREVCEKVKSIDPGVLTVLGGMHPTVAAESILKNCEAVDILVRGEGEQTFLELVCRYLKEDGYGGVDGISHREKGRVVHNRDREMSDDLDRYPPAAHHLVDNDRYRMRSITSSRGCFHRCAFCSIQEMYRHTVRLRSIDRIHDEIQMLVELGARRVMFTDDNFTFSLKRVRELCGSIIAKGWNHQVEFYVEGRIDDVCRNPLLAKILSDAGIRGLYAGAESGSKRILDYYRKGLKPEDVLEGISVCVEQNLTPVVSFILLGPRDDKGTVRETIRLAKSAFEKGAEIAYTETLIPYPGTPIQRELEEDGRFRELGSVYYFQSYEGIDVARFFRLCDLAREMTFLLHGSDRYFAMQKTYHELSFLEEMLDGRIPVDFTEYQRKRSGREAEFRGENLAELLSQGIGSKVG